jgi:ATP synthase protein I
MPSDNKQDDSKAPVQNKARDASNLSALALELPFTLVGAIAVGVAMGYFLDRWLHTKPWLTLVFGALGFFAGVREVLRRMPAGGNGSQSG